MGKLARRFIKFIETAIGSNPQRPALILMNGPHHIVTQACGVIGIMSVMSKLTRLSIKSIQSLAPRSNPEHARLVFIS